MLLSALADDLNQRGISATVAERVVSVLLECDVVGFAPTTLDPKVRDLFEQALAVIADLEEERP